MNLREKQIRPGDRRFDIRSDRDESKAFTIKEGPAGTWTILRDNDKNNERFQTEAGTSRRNAFIIASAIVHSVPEAWARSLTAPTPL